MGAIIATFTSWRVIFGVAAGMSLVGLILAFLFVPTASEVCNPKMIDAVPIKTKREALAAFNPMHVFRQFMYPRVLLAVSSFMVP